MQPAEKIPGLCGMLSGNQLPAAAHLTAIREFALILGGLFFLDILTTQVVLWMGGVELNPLMTGIVSEPVLHTGIKVAILIMILVVSVIAERQVKGSSTVFYCILITLYLFVIVNNIFVILPCIPV